MECACEKQSVTRTNAARNAGKNSFCCVNCDGWFNKRNSDQNKKKINPRRVKPAHRDWEE